MQDGWLGRLQIRQTLAPFSDFVTQPNTCSTNFNSNAWTTATVGMPTVYVARAAEIKLVGIHLVNRVKYFVEYRITGISFLKIRTSTATDRRNRSVQQIGTADRSLKS